MKFCKIFIISILVTLASCGKSYKNKSTNIEQALRFNKEYNFKSLTLFNVDYLLFSEECGLYYFLKNDINKSLSCFNNAKAYYRKVEESSKLKLEKALSYTILSDTATPYESNLYEKGLVHYYAGLAYLAQNNLEKANIEFMASEENHKFSEELHQKQIISSENKINNFFQTYNFQSNDIKNLLEESNTIRAKEREKFVNGNTLYVAGLVKEISKSYNQALVNYKNAYTLNPSNQYILEDLYRLSLIYDQDYAKYLQKYNPKLVNYNFLQYKKENTIYLIYEQGFIPKKENLKIPFIGVDNGLILTINLPIYQQQYLAKNVNLSVNNNASVAAQQTVNLYNLAKNQLIEDYPIIIAKQVSKLAVQIVGQKTLRYLKQGWNPLSIAFGGVYLFDSSDLRSWRTLPSYIKVAKLTISHNINNAVITINEKKYPIDVSLSQGEVAFIHVFDTGAEVYKKVLYKYKK